jgi:hypothetical protein
MISATYNTVYSETEIMPRNPHFKLKSQIESLRIRFGQHENLPFHNILSDKMETLASEYMQNTRNRIFSFDVTVSAFISQVLNADPSCRKAVANVVAERVAMGLPECSYNTGPYCNARLRLSEHFIYSLVTDSARSLDQQSNSEWKWKNRSLKLVDGTTLIMADTDENQLEYPQSDSQKENVGFPITRLVALTSLSTGVLLDYENGPYQGKETGENALFRQIISRQSLEAGDILLGDSYYCSYFMIVLLQRMGVDVIFEQHGSRKTDFRIGEQIGTRDHIVILGKPQRPKWMDKEEYQQMPTTLTVREFKSKGKVIVTTIIDPKYATKNEIGKLYSKRWLVEVDFLFIKAIMQMDFLRCKTPEMVRKEIGIHLLAYNLIRTVIAQSACKTGVSPREISFKGTIQLLDSFSLLFIIVDEERYLSLYNMMLSKIATHKIGNRPGRSEPRAIKRRPKPYPFLNESRALDRKRSFNNKKYA